MVQVKKDEIRHSILESARTLFTNNGYHKTTIISIAKRARLSVGNIYAYFPSKLDLLYEIYRPWMQSWFEDLEKEVRKESEPTSKTRRLLEGMWYDFPASNPGLANSLMEALASSDVRPRRPDDLLAWLEKRIAILLSETECRDEVPTRAHEELAHLIMMAQDGYIINFRRGGNRNVNEIARIVSETLYRGSETSSFRVSKVKAKQFRKSEDTRKVASK